MFIKYILLFFYHFLGIWFSNLAFIFCSLCKEINWSGILFFHFCRYYHISYTAGSDRNIDAWLINASLFSLGSEQEIKTVLENQMANTKKMIEK